MSKVAKVIEIIDSDDDIIDGASIANCEANVQSTQDINPPPSENMVIETNDQQPLATLSQNESSKIISEAPSTLPVIRTYSAKSRSRRSRKSTHQPMRASPEMQFETISLDDDEEQTTSIPIRNATKKDSGEPETSGQFHPKIFKTMPKILASKSSPIEEHLDTVFKELFMTEDVIAMMQQIAEDRVRVNDLLRSNAMLEMNFLLYTTPELLKFQLEDRLQQSKIGRETSARTDPQTPKKRVRIASTSQHSSK